MEPKNPPQYTELEDLSVVLDNSESYSRLHELSIFDMKPRRIDDNPRNQFEVYGDFLNKTVELCSSSSTAEQEEALKIVSRKDPIMWDLIMNKMPHQQRVYTIVLLKQMSITFNTNLTVIKGEYDGIVKPHFWGRKLRAQHTQYQDFVAGRYKNEFVIEVIICSFVFAFLIYLFK